MPIDGMGKKVYCCKIYHKRNARNKETQVIVKKCLYILVMSLIMNISKNDTVGKKGGDHPLSTL